jgi:hypothetical protein
MYKNFTDRVNVNIGKEHGHENFFAINTWNHRTTVPRFYPEYNECNASLVGSTEGSIYPVKCQKDTVLWYWRKTLCRPVPLHFEDEMMVGGLKAYKYLLRSDVFDRLQNKTADCYKGDNLPNGLSDLSKCFFGMYTFILFSSMCASVCEIDKQNNFSNFSSAKYDIRSANCCVISTFL